MMMPLTLANKLTIGRILAVPFFVASIVYYAPEHSYLRYVALGIFCLAILTDVIDGYVARTQHQKTTAGAILDPLADKILLISAFTCLYQVKELALPYSVPLSILFVVISRDVILIIGAVTIYLVNHGIDIKATVWGKMSTLFQVVAIVSIFVRLDIFPAIWYVVAFFTVVSGLDYLRSGVKILNASSR